MAKNVVLKITQKGAKKTTSALKSVAGGLASIGTKATLVGAGFGALSTKLAGDFQQNLFEVKTLMGETGQSIDSMSNELRNAAAQSGLALSSLSKAKYDIVSAGFSSAAESAEVLAASSRLAVGGVTTAAGAADLLTTALNAYGQSASEVNHVSDVLFTTVRLGKTTMDELGASLGQVLPFARSANLSLEGVGAAMATMTAAGINTAESSTALKAAIVSLTSPTKSSKDAMEAAGIEIVRYKDGTLNLVETIRQFEDISPEEMTKFIPNIRAVASIQTMANNFEVLEANVNSFATESAGASEKAFETMAESFNTQFAMLRNNVQNIMITLGNAIIKVIQPKIEEANEILSGLGDIGFDVIAETMGENIQLIMDVLTQSLDIFFTGIENRLVYLKLSFLDAINPFVNMDDKLKEMHGKLEEEMTLSTDVIKQLFSNLYADILMKAEESTKGQKGEADKVEEIVKKDLEIRRTAADKIVGFEVKKVNAITTTGETQEIFSKQTKKSLESQAVGYGMSGDSAEEAAQKTVRAAIRIAIAEVIKKAVTRIPFPFNIAAAAAGAAAITGVIEDTVGKAKLPFAEGGIVPGVGNRDTVPAMLTPGELILNKAQQENLVKSEASSIVLNISAPLVDETILDVIIPKIEEARRLKLA